MLCCAALRSALLQPLAVELEPDNCLQSSRCSLFANYMRSPCSLQLLAVELEPENPRDPNAVLVLHSDR